MQGEDALQEDAMLEEAMQEEAMQEEAMQEEIVEEVTPPRAAILPRGATLYARSPSALIPSMEAAIPSTGAKPTIVVVLPIDGLHPPWMVS